MRNDMRHPYVVAMLTACALSAAQVHAQTPSQPMPPQQSAARMPSAALVTACVDAQQQVASLAAQVNRRLEDARQTNSPQQMRAALADLQAALVEIQNHAKQCSPLQAVPTGDPHAGLATPGGTGKPLAPGIPVVNPGSTMVAPGAVEPHAGHAMGTAPKPSPASTTGKPAPAAPDPHAGHAAPKPAPPKKEAVPSKAPTKDPHAGHTKEPSPQKPGTVGEAAPSAAEAVDPVCGLRVDRSSAPKATHQGQTYSFCSEQHRQSFVKNPAKYLRKGSR